MITFVARRIVSGIIVLLVVSLLTFSLAYASGTDIARNVLGSDATQQQVAAESARLGIDRPVIVQYADWLSGAWHFDFGRSFFTSQPVRSTLATHIPVTLSLVFFGFVLTAVFGVLFGVVAATRGGWVDRTVQLFSVAGFAVPSYFLALVLVLAIALPFPALFPATGYVPLTSSVTEWTACLTLPAVALTIGGVASVAQQLRGALLDTLGSDYVRTLRSRGVSERAIIYRHALRNSFGPALNVLALHVVALLGGSVIIERIFALPGIGSLATDASLKGDVPEVMGIVVFAVAVVVVVNLLIDMINAWLNPKVRLR